MEQKKIRCSFLEVRKHIEKSERESVEFEEYVKAERIRIARLIEQIKSHDRSVQTWMMDLPIELFANRKRIVVSSNQKFNWKKAILDTFQKYEQPMDSEMLFAKFLLDYSTVPTDRRFAIRNISAALNYLIFEDNKLLRIKMEKARAYVYGLYHFFDLEGELKKSYWEKYKIEKL